jgi:phosphoribosylformylglycinamidine synthase
LGELGFQGIGQVRIGKLIELQIEADDATQAERIATEAADKLLANPVMEDYRIVIREASSV